MAFDSLSEKLQNVFKNLRSKGRLTEDDVNQVVPDLGLFLRTRLGGADIHALVHLVGIGVDDFRLLALGLQRLGNGDAKPRLAGRSGTDDGHDLTGFGLAFSGGRHRFAPLPDSDRR